MTASAGRRRTPAPPFPQPAPQLQRRPRRSTPAPVPPPPPLHRLPVRRPPEASPPEDSSIRFRGIRASQEMIMPATATKGGGSDAVDHSGYLACSVGSGARDGHYARRLRSRSDCAGHHRSCDPADPGPPGSLTPAGRTRVRGGTPAAGLRRGAPYSLAPNWRYSTAGSTPPPPGCSPEVPLLDARTADRSPRAARSAPSARE